MTKEKPLEEIMAAAENNDFVCSGCSGLVSEPEVKKLTKLVNAGAIKNSKPKTSTPSSNVSGKMIAERLNNTVEKAVENVTDKDIESMEKYKVDPEEIFKLYKLVWTCPICASINQITRRKEDLV